MSPNPFGSLPTSHRLPGDPPQDESVVVDGLERALAQARTKIPDHDTGESLGFPSPREAAVRALRAEVPAPVPFDSRAVMDVLRGAIDRYTQGDGHKQGAWVDELAEAKDNAIVATIEDPPPRHLEAGYAPDRRPLAAAVIVVSLIVGSVLYTQFGIGSGGGESVKTDTPVTVQGKAVTTLTTPSTVAAPTTAPTTASTEPATTLPPETTAPATTTPKTPETAPPTTAAPPPPPPPPPSTEPPTTEPPTTTPTTTQSCDNILDC